MMNSKKLFSAAGAAALLLFISLTAYFSPGSRNYYSRNEYHTDLNYEDIEIKWVDENAVLKNLDDYESAVISGDEEAILRDYDRCEEDYETIWTERQLADIRSLSRLSRKKKIL